jgi:hypothetical protein
MASNVLIGIAGLAIDGLITMVENNKLSKAELQEILNKADLLKAATDAAVDDLLDAVGDD